MLTLRYASLLLEKQISLQVGKGCRAGAGGPGKGERDPPPRAECLLSVGLLVDAGESDRFFFPWPYQPHQCFCETVGGTH